MGCNFFVTEGRLVQKYCLLAYVSGLFLPLVRLGSRSSTEARSYFLFVFRFLLSFRWLVRNSFEGTGRPDHSFDKPSAPSESEHPGVMYVCTDSPTFLATLLDLIPCSPPLRASCIPSRRGLSTSPILFGLGRAVMDSPLVVVCARRRCWAASTTSIGALVRCQCV